MVYEPTLTESNLGQNVINLLREALIKKEFDWYSRNSSFEQNILLKIYTQGSTKKNYSKLGRKIDLNAA